MIIIKGFSVAGDASALAEWAGVQWVLTRRSDAQCRHLGEVAEVAGNERHAVFERSRVLYAASKVVLPSLCQSGGKVGGSRR